MGKTHRFSYDKEDYGWQNHRISRRDMAKARRDMAQQIITTANAVDPVIEPDLGIKIAFGWLPPKNEQDNQHYVREARLDLLHTLGQSMIEAYQDA